MTNRRTYGKAMSMPAGIGIGVGISILIILLGCAVMAMLLSKESMGMEALGYGAMIILLGSSYAGAVTAASLIKRRRLMVCGIHMGVTLAILLLINGVLFGGAISGIAATILLLLGGAGCAALTNLGGKGKRRSKPRIRPTG